MIRAVFCAFVLLFSAFGRAHSKDESAETRIPGDVARAITAEIHSLEKKMEVYNQMLDTERQQVAVLRKLREELLKGSTVKGADGASTWTIEELTEYVLARSAQTARYAGRASSTGASNIPGIAVNPNDAFHTFFVKRNEIPLFEGSLVDLDILSIPLTPSGGGAGRSHTSPKKSGSLSSPTPVINFIIVTTTKGFLYVYEAEQMNLLTTIETQHLSRIAETRCAYFHFDAFCVTAGVDGGVKLHSLTVYNHGHFVAGHRLQLLPKETPSPSPSGTDAVKKKDQARERKLSDAEIRHGSVPRNVVWAASDTMILREETSGETTCISNPLGYGRLKYVLLGHSNGLLEIYLRNGTLAYSFPIVHSAPIRAMEKSASSVAVAQGRQVSFYNPGRQEMLKYSCHGGVGNIISLAYDKIMTHILYAGSDNGAIYAFNTRSRGKTSQACALIHQILSNSTSRLLTSKGYLLAFGGNELNLFNVSSIMGVVTPRLIATQMFGASQNDTEGFAALSDVGSRSPLESAFVVGSGASQECTGNNDVCPTLRVGVFSTLLRWEPPGNGTDIGWIRMPLMIIGILCVFGYQMLGNRRVGRGGMMESMRGAGLNPGEMEELKNVIGRYQGGGRGASMPRSGRRQAPGGGGGGRAGSAFPL